MQLSASPHAPLGLRYFRREICGVDGGPQEGARPTAVRRCLHYRHDRVDGGRFNAGHRVVTICGGDNDNARNPEIHSGDRRQSDEARNLLIELSICEAARLDSPPAGFILVRIP